MATNASSHEHTVCRVRGCPLVLPHIEFAEWGIDGFLIASHRAPAAIPQHEHFPFQISLPVEGSWLHSFGGGQPVLVAGKAAFIPSGVTHGTRGLDCGEIITINAEIDWCAEHCELPRSVQRRAAPGTANAEPFAGILAQTATLLRASDPDEILLESIGLTVTLGIFHSLGFRSSRNAPMRLPGPVRRAQRWVDDHLDEKITLANLASVAQCSQWHLIRLFNSFLRMSPARYVAVTRLEKARELLRKPGAAIAEVALQCGFSGQSHFTRAFTQEYGVTPGLYRSKKTFSGA